RSATYHVWDLYQNHTGRVHVPARVAGPSVTVGVREGDVRGARGQFRHTPDVLGLLDVSVTLSEDGRHLYVAAINRSPEETITARRDAGLPVTAAVARRQLGVGVEYLFATNAISSPETVTLSAPEQVTVNGSYDFPPHSVTVLEWDL